MLKGLKLLICLKYLTWVMVDMLEMVVMIEMVKMVVMVELEREWAGVVFPMFWMTQNCLEG